MEVDTVSDGVLVFGAAESGQLGTGTDDDAVAVPRLLAAPPGVRIVSVALGLCHSLWLTDAGALFAAGLNDVGQCGVGSPSTLAAPQRLESLETRQFVQVAAGDAFSAAVADSGEVLTFGANDVGQCGQGAGAPLNAKPRTVKGVPALTAVALGSEHALLLDRQAAVWASGQGAHGALGLGDTGSRATPERVRGLLSAVAVRQVAAGERHSAALTFSGSVIVWGSRANGALGLPALGGLRPDHDIVMLPRTLPGARGVRLLATCGAHTLALTAAGTVLSWGRDESGEATSPCPVELDESGGARVRHVAVGVAHSLLLLDDGRVLAWGGARCGQLGLGVAATDKVWPTLLEQLPGAPTAVAAGGYSSALLLDPQATLGPPVPETLSAAAVSDLARRTDWQRLAQLADRVLSSPVLAAASFVGADGTSHSFEACEACYQALLAAFDAAPSVVQAMSAALPRMLTALRQEMDELIAAQAADGSSSGAPTPSRTPSGAALGRSRSGVTLLAAPLLTVLQSPLLSHPSEGRQLVSAGLIIDAAPADVKLELGRQLEACPLDIFGGRIVAGLLRALDSALADAASSAPSSERSSAVVVIVRLLGLCRDANVRSGILPPDAFYSPWLSEHLDMERDYVTWAQHGPAERGKPVAVPWSFCSEPWLFDPGAKAKLLRTEALIRMSTVVQQSRAQGRFGASAIDQLPVLQPVLSKRADASRPPFRRLGASSRPASGVRGDFFVLRVRRDELINDTLEAVAEQSVQTLLKPLRVVFEGEPAIDEGGVRKELFQLLVDDLFGPQFGMWSWNASTRCNWFHLGGFGAAAEYFLVGLVVGLAIHNGVILDLKFPPLMWRMLLGDRRVDLEALRDMQPDLARGLTQLLEYDGDDVEDVFCASFAVEAESVTGEPQLHELVPGGKDIVVSSANRDEYVRRYVEFLLVGGVADAFDAFHRGFLLLCDGPALSFLTPAELEVIVCGSPVLDFHALEAGARYDEASGFTRDHRTVRLFWEVAHSLSTDDKHALLLFATGCDRAPVGGLGNLKFTLQRSGPDSMSLPTAHTCFNMLSLPEYGSRAKLRDRLCTAIQNAKGFGIQ